MNRTVLAAALAGWLGISSPAPAADLGFGYDDSGAKPALLIIPDSPIAEMYVEVTVGSRTFTFERTNVAGGSTVRLEWNRISGVGSVQAFVRAVFADGFVGEYNIPIELETSDELAVDLSGASADVEKRVLNVPVTGHVAEADVTAYGVGREVLDQRTVPINDGPGTIAVPWVGDPDDVVILEIKLRNEGAWAEITYSPWFLDIPHDDVLFDTDQATIAASEEWKMEHTLGQLEDVVTKYGDLVPVKLYIAGCTDTVGDKAHNLDLSRRRARAIGTWLRKHGFTHPIYYYGFGEGLLAQQTGDGVDNASNRRALYIVSSNPPPAGSGIPSVGWHKL